MPFDGIESEKQSISRRPPSAPDSAAILAEFESAAPSIAMVDLGRCTYHTARRQQERLVSLRIENRIADTIIYCEHEPVLTLGARLDGCSDLEIPDRVGTSWSLDQWREHGFEVVRCSRGGEATYHGPGQLVIYPVISLRDRRIGVAEFVATVSRAIALFLNRKFLLGSGLAAEFDIDCPGIWILNSGVRQKIGSVGLRIRRGVSDHGFSVNLNCDLEPFLRFSPCGQNGSAVTSIGALTGTASEVESAASEIHQLIEQSLDPALKPGHVSGRLPVRKA